MNILVSACLLGVPCRYDGKSVPCPAVAALSGRHKLIPVCPEVLGGLNTPRTPAERSGSRVITRDGDDVTKAYLAGAKAALETAKKFGCRYAVLKEHSPSCGTGKIYDGTFSGRLISGSGVAAELLSGSGITVVGESGTGSIPAAAEKPDYNT